MRVCQRFSGLEMVLGVEVHTAKKSAAIERIGNIDGRLKARANRIHPKNAPAKGDGTL